MRGKDRSGSGGRSRRGGRRIRGGEGNGSKDDAEKRNAARSCASFSLEDETKEPWPPPLLSLGYAMLDLDPDQLHSTNK